MTNPYLAPDELVRATAMNGRLRILACVSTDVTNELQARHRLWPVATAALGRTATIAAMMAALMKANERLTVQVQGDGPLGAILVDAAPSGDVRGYVQNPHVHLPPTAAGKLDVGRGVGHGLLYVIRDHGLKDFYRGSVELQTGEIADDFTYYFAVSEQTPSAVGAGVLVGTDNRAIVAGGFLMQLLPDHDEADALQLEQRLLQLTSVTDFLGRGATAADLLHYLAPDAGPLSASGVQFHCTCSRARLQAVLLTLGQEELRSMQKEQSGAEMVCRFCAAKYLFAAGDLEQLIRQLSATASNGIDPSDAERGWSTP